MSPRPLLRCSPLALALGVMVLLYTCNYLDCVESAVILTEKLPGAQAGDSEIILLNGIGMIQSKDNNADLFQITGNNADQMQIENVDWTHLTAQTPNLYVVSHGCGDSIWFNNHELTAAQFVAILQRARIPQFNGLKIYMYVCNSASGDNAQNYLITKVKTSLSQFYRGNFEITGCNGFCTSAPARNLPMALRVVKSGAEHEERAFANQGALLAPQTDGRRAFDAVKNRNNQETFERWANRVFSSDGVQQFFTHLQEGRPINPDPNLPNDYSYMCPIDDNNQFRSVNFQHGFMFKSSRQLEKLTKQIQLNSE